jgi:hypothetical protein
MMAKMLRGREGFHVGMDWVPLSITEEKLMKGNHPKEMQIHYLKVGRRGRKNIENFNANSWVKREIATRFAPYELLQMLRRETHKLLRRMGVGE